VDHDATALAVHAAMASTGRGHPHEMALYHAGPAGIDVHHFLPGETPSVRSCLDEASQVRKAAMCARYVTQEKYAAYFEVDVERYRCAPRYDFALSPTPGRPLLYESGDAEAGQRWRTHATRAIDELGPAGVTVLLPGASPTSTTDVAGVDDDRVARVSVIVRTIGRPTLAAALDSINAQTYPNIEIVLVDAGGHGAPPAWEPREGVLLQSHAAVGCDRAAAANVGMAAATGAYIAFLDDDDWYHPEHIASLATWLTQRGDVQVAYGDVEVVEMYPDRVPQARAVFASAYDPIALLCENYIPLNAVLVSRARLEGARFDESLPLFEDWDFLIGLSRRTQFEHVAGIGAVYRWPPGSGVNNPQLTTVVQERVFAKWQGSLTASEHAAILRRAIKETELKEGRHALVTELKDHLRAQDEELARAREVITGQERLLAELHSHLQRQDSELAQARSTVQLQEQQLGELRPHLRAQDAELDSLRPLQARVLDLEAASADIHRQLTAARAELQRLYSSRSWRWTAPLRQLVSRSSGDTTAKDPNDD
jgi:hypothetical protein